MASATASNASGWGGAGSQGDNEPPSSIDELYHFNLVPSELFLKFRKGVQGIRVGINLEFFNFDSNDFRTKLVLKPCSPDRRWRFICEPLDGDVRLLSKKIPLTNFLSLQVGISHNFQSNATGWNWRLCTGLGGDGVSQIRNKTSIHLLPCFDLRVGWRADYILPDVQGAVGTGEPLLKMNYGRLHASIDRVEAILTHAPIHRVEGILTPASADTLEEVEGDLALAS